MRRVVVFLALLAATTGAEPAASLGTGSKPPTIRVRSAQQFEAAVAVLRDSGGTVVLLPQSYTQTLVVPARSARPLRILGVPGVRVAQVLLDHTQHVSLGRLTVSPADGDALVDVEASRYVDLHDLVVTAEGTHYAASVSIPDSRHVTIRRSTFTHCGDSSWEWSNCVLLGVSSRDVIVEDDWFHDCYGCDFIHGRFGLHLTVRRNRFQRALPCHIGLVRCGHQDLIELFAGQGLLVEGNRFGVYERGGAQLYLTNAIDHVRIVNNVFLGTDPLVPGYRSRVGLIIGSSRSRRLPHYVTVVNNTILTGAPRTDGYAGSIRMSSVYGGIPRDERPVVVNNVIGLLRRAWPVCAAAQASISNVVVRGVRCSASDRVGLAHLDSSGRPTAASTLLIDRANRRYAPALDSEGRPRRGAPDIGAFEYPG